MFSRYWTEIIVIGILPLLALICLNYGIYLKIRKSAKFRKLNDGFVVRFGKAGQRSNNVNNRHTGQHQLRADSADLGRLSNSNSDTAERKAKHSPPRNLAPGASPFKARSPSVVVTSATVMQAGPPPAALAGGNERSTKVLVGIVVVFLVCHVVRLVIQVGNKDFRKKAFLQLRIPTSVFSWWWMMPDFGGILPQ